MRPGDRYESLMILRNHCESGALVALEISKDAFLFHPRNDLALAKYAAEKIVVLSAIVAEIDGMIKKPT